VLDYGAGSGYYSEIIGRAVGPRGGVTAWNSSGFMGNQQLRTALTELTARTPNVTVGSGDLTSVDFGRNGYDLALLHLVYHDAYWQSEQYHLPRIDPNTLVRALYRAVKPGGSVVVIDHVAAAGGDTRAVVEQYHRIDPAVVRADFERAGFRFAGQSELLRVPTDPHNVNVFTPSIRGRTDRFMYRFTKPLGRRR
jgi:predicted methyltransferase